MSSNSSMPVAQALQRHSGSWKQSVAVQPTQANRSSTLAATAFGARTGAGSEARELERAPAHRNSQTSPT
jgi:hypothetical protein